jgi:hypothetical protein
MKISENYDECMVDLVQTLDREQLQIEETLKKALFVEKIYENYNNGIYLKSKFKSTSAIENSIRLIKNPTSNTTSDKKNETLFAFLEINYDLKNLKIEKNNNKS